MAPETLVSPLLSQLPGSPGPENSPEQAEANRKKKKSKVRSAWISFVGRILAQMLGAVATVMLGLMVVQSYQLPVRGDHLSAAVTGQPAGRVRPPRADGVKALAVLPLENFSGNPQQDAFADGMTEALIAKFAQVRGLQVTSRTSSMNFRGQRALLPSIARELGVDLVLEGSVVMAGGRVRITAQLIDASTDLHTWTGIYEPIERDVLALHSAAAGAIVRDVCAAVPGLRQHPAVSSKAPTAPAKE